MSYIKCEEAVIQIDPTTAECATGFINSQPDYDTLLTQLVALNEFDYEQSAGIVVICLSTFLVGFGVGVVIKLLRRL